MYVSQTLAILNEKSFFQKHRFLGRTWLKKYSLTELVNDFIHNLIFLLYTYCIFGIFYLATYGM